MLVDEFVDIKIGSKSIGYYRSLGYSDILLGSTITIPIAEIQAGSKFKVTIRCSQCGATKLTPYASYVLIMMRGGQGKLYKCKECYKKHPIDFINEEFLKFGYVPMFSVYKDNTEKLEYLCPLHPSISQFISYHDLSGGHGCRFCGQDAGKKLTRHNIEYVRKAFTNRGYIPTFTTYTDNKQLLTFICERHLDKGEQDIKYNSLQQGSGCYYCGNDKSIGTLRNKNRKMNYTIGNMLRKAATRWATRSLNFYGKECVLTRKTEGLEIHHLISFNSLVEWAHKATGILLRVESSDYSEKELRILREMVFYFHEKYTPLGVPIAHTVHHQFHEIYGYSNNTVAQWNEFEIKYTKFLEFKYNANTDC